MRKQLNPRRFVTFILEFTLEKVFDDPDAVDAAYLNGMPPPHVHSV